MQTPPPSPRTLNENSPISCRGLLFSGFNREGGIRKEQSPVKGHATSPPQKPKKLQKNRPNSEEIYACLPLFKGLMSEDSKVIGKGDFGTVSEVRLKNPPGTPELQPIAVKEIMFDTRGVSPRDLQYEVGRLGSPGCVTGVAYRTKKSALLFMSLGVSLNKLDFSKMTKEMLDWVIQSVIDLCMKKLVLGLLADIKPENFIFLPKGTPTVVKDSEGQPCMGPPTAEDEIVYCDLGSVDPTSGGTKIYGVLPSESDAEKPDFEAKMRQFKATMMEALIRDAAKPSDKKVEQIVAPLVPPEWVYAAGVQHQT